MSCSFPRRIRRTTAGETCSPVKTSTGIQIYIQKLPPVYLLYNYLRLHPQTFVESHITDKTKLVHYLDIIRKHQIRTLYTKELYLHDVSPANVRIFRSHSGLVGLKVTQFTS